MFESAELSHVVDKASFERSLVPLREGLIQAQVELVRRAEFPVLIVVAGMDGAGRGEIVNDFNAWMDPRHIQTHGMGDPSADEHEMPAIWRFWRVLPPKGKIGLMLGSWYTWPLLDRARGTIRAADFTDRMQQALRFERMLVDEGALVLKFWLHLSRKQQRRRFEALGANRDTRWRVTRRDWDHHALYGKLRDAAERAILLTSTAEAPWTIVSGADANYRSLTIGQTVLDALRRRLDGPGTAAATAAPAGAPAALPRPAIDGLHVLRSLDLGLSLDRGRYAPALEKAQGRLALLSRDARMARKAMVVVFEGNDAAGKGGAIRRVTAALDARMYQVVPIAAPTDEERARPYLWRFWRHVPRPGRFTLFDRSWYGRVLVERVEGYCSQADWMRAYGEIVDFEQQLQQHGIIVVKFWLSISPDEQLRRFKERESIAFKRFKITDEDWRNRDRWEAYEAAVCDMVDRTSTSASPWTLVEANDKRHARIKILRTLGDRLAEGLGR